jgi:membrane protease YdiL (CAAX protease family)
MLFAIPWDFWLIFLFLMVVLPWRGRERMRQLLAQPETSGRDRIRLYLSTILFQWVLTAIVAWRAAARGLTLRELGLLDRQFWPALPITLVGAALIALGHWMNLRRMSVSDHPAAEKLRQMAARLFPRSAMETAVYIGLALTAGICEEFIFRGFVIAVLFRVGLSAWIVVVFSSLMFGLAHLYQGKGGSVGTGILGMLFAGVRIAYDTIFPVVIWHAVLDIVAGIAGARYFAKQQAEETSPNGTGP